MHTNVNTKVKRKWKYEQSLYGVRLHARLSTPISKLHGVYMQGKGGVFIM
jgi:hypothetical protein